jgi:hypothetical protein
VPAQKAAPARRAPAKTVVGPNSAASNGVAGGAPPAVPPAATTAGP